MIYWNEKFSRNVERKTITENKNPMVAKERKNKMKKIVFAKCVIIKNPDFLKNKKEVDY